MNISIKRKFFLAVVAMLAAGSLIFAQVKVSLTIRSNVSGAQVYLNNNLAGSTSPNLSLQVFPGTYTIRVVKAGYSEFRTSIVAVQSPITIIANLKGGTPQTPPSTPQTPPTPSYPVPSPACLRPPGGFSSMRASAAPGSISMAPMQGRPPTRAYGSAATTRSASLPPAMPTIRKEYSWTGIRG